MSTRMLAMLAVNVVAASGCAFGIGQPDPAVLRERAQLELSRWADAVNAAGGPQRFVLVGDLTGMDGVWEEAVGGNNKQALMAGSIEAAVPLSTAVPPVGQLRFADGSTETAELVSAAAALDELAADAEAYGAACGGCEAVEPLRVTGAALSTTSIQTNRGDAVVPAWSFAIEGTAVRVTRVAVARAARVTPSAALAADGYVGIRIDRAEGSPQDLSLTVSFTAAAEPGQGGCTATYDAEAVESDLAIVVIVHEHAANLGPCRAVGYSRTATVSLEKPLASRAVLEIQQGLPVPIARRQ